MLQHLVEAHLAGSRDYSSPLWTILMFESFVRNAVVNGHPAPGCDTQ
jgi:asparagine synthase (glutamine-hydrolysing)